RWRKLVYNACLNSICALTGLDTGRIRLADGAIDGLVKPAMEEIRAAAKAGNFTEFENIVGEPLRVGTALGVPMPTLKVLYHLLQAIQWRTKEARGKITIPPKGTFVAE
ncbi:hypothetical protein KCU63_g20307, partial [Aureobasidium melanogenum]